LRAMLKFWGRALLLGVLVAGVGLVHGESQLGERPNAGPGDSPPAEPNTELAGDPGSSGSRHRSEGPAEETGFEESTPAANQGAGPTSPSLEFHGFLDSVMHFEELREKECEWWLNTTRATFRTFATVNEHFDFKVGVVGRMLIGTKALDYVPFMPWHVRDELIPDDPVRGRPGTGHYLVGQAEGDLYVQEAYGNINAGRLFFRLGRQKIETGVGYSYAPTDLLNRKNPLDPTYEPDGFDAARVGFRLSSQSDFQALVVPRGVPAYLARLENRAESGKLALQFTSVARPRVNWNAINTPAGLGRLWEGASVSDFEADYRWNQVSGEFVREIQGTRIYGEAGIAFIQDRQGSDVPPEFIRNQLRFLGGLERTFDSRLRVIFEYMRQGDGRPGGVPIDLNDMMAFNVGETLLADRDSLYGEVSCPVAQKTDLTVKSLAVLNHAAVFVNPWLNFDLRSNLRFSVSVYKFFGTTGSSYEDVGIGTYGELRASF